MNNNPLKGIQLTNLNIPAFDSQIRNLEIDNSEMLEAVADKLRKDDEYNSEVLQTLKNIEANTVGLNEIIPLLSGSLEKQDEILEYLRGALAISASETPEEAESKLRQMMGQATTLSTDIETVQKLYSFAKTIFALYMKMYLGE